MVLAWLAITLLPLAPALEAEPVVAFLEFLAAAVESQQRDMFRLIQSAAVAELAETLLLLPAVMASYSSCGVRSNDL